MDNYENERPVDPFKEVRTDFMAAFLCFATGEEPRIHFDQSGENLYFYFPRTPEIIKFTKIWFESPIQIELKEYIDIYLRIRKAMKIAIEEVKYNGKTRTKI